LSGGDTLSRGPKGSYDTKLQSEEALAKFILGWWHRLSSLCKCLLKVDTALTTLRFQDALYEEYQHDITQI
jgi:hypothetical protein